MEGLPANFKELSAVEQDKALNAVLAAAEARLACQQGMLDHLNGLTPELDHHRGSISSAASGLLGALRGWRTEIQRDLAAAGEDASGEVKPQTLSFTKDTLFERLRPLVARVISDPRWEHESDDLGVSVLGMLLYGLALAIGRTDMFLNVEDIDAAVIQCICVQIGAAEKWTTGLIADANASAFDPAHHAGNHELIGVGHSYYGAPDEPVVENVFANIQNSRRELA